MNKKIRKLLVEGILISPEILDKEFNLDEFLLKTKKNKPVVFDLSTLRNLNNKNLEQVKWGEYDKKKVDSEKAGKKKTEEFDLLPKPITEKKVKIIDSYEDINSKISINDFVNLYNNRYLTLQKTLIQRQELQGARTIRKIKTSKNNETVSFVALILEKRTTKNNHIMLLLEDQTGTTKALIHKKNKELIDVGKNLTLDETIGVVGAKGDRIVFINKIIVPEIPLSKELKKSPLKEVAVFISDIHLGSKAFLRKDFEKFINWIRGETGTPEQRELVKRVKYLFIAGDLVEGIGIYPGHEKDLEIKDIYGQFKEFCEYIKKIPQNISVIICPGNHDPVRIAEPQPRVPEELIEEIKDLPNLYFVSSPSFIKIGETEDFSGLDVLMYHGYSFPFYANNIESIRLKGGLKKTENIMEYLLKKRHLAPTHGSTRYQLSYQNDPLLIKTVPDFFVTGHIHRTSVKNYRNISMLNCSCWISQTPYQEKRGLEPQPSRAICVDLHTRETKILNFAEK